VVIQAGGSPAVALDYSAPPPGVTRFCPGSELLKMLHALEKGFAASFLPCLRVHAAIFASRLRWLGPFVSAAFNAASRRPLGPFVSAALNPACRRVLCVSATIGSEQPGN